MTIRRILLASAIALGTLAPVLAISVPTAHANPTATTCLSLPTVTLPSVCDIKAGVSAGVSASVSGSLSLVASVNALIAALTHGTLAGTLTLIANLRTLLCLT